MENTQSLNLTDPADTLASPPGPDLIIRRGGPTPPGTRRSPFPELRQVVEYAHGEGRGTDAHGRVNLAGLAWEETRNGPDEEGIYHDLTEKFVIRDQYTLRDTETERHVREPISEFVATVFKGDATIPEAIAQKRGSFKPTAPVFERKLKIHKTMSRDAMYGTPKVNKYINKGKVKYTWLPRLYRDKRGWGPKPFGSAPKVRKVDHDILMVDIDVYDHDENHVRTESWTGDKFAAHLRDPTGPTGFWLSKTPPPKAPGELPASEQVREEISVTERKDPFADILYYLQSKGLPDNLVGICWERGGKRFQVVQDSLLRERVRARAYGRVDVVRTFCIREYDAAGNIVGQTLKRDAELRDYFRDTTSPTKDHPLTTKPIIKKGFIPLKNVYRISPRTPEAAPEARTVVPNLPTALDKIMNLRLLNYGDVADGDHPERTAREILFDKDISKYLDTLHLVVAEKGRNKVKALATQMQKTYATAIDLLELPAPEHHKNSASWMLEEMLEQRYYATHLDEAGEEQIAKYGHDISTPIKRNEFHIPDPFEDSPTGLYARRRILQRAVAVDYLASAFIIEPGKRQKTDNDGLPEFWDDAKTKPKIEIVKMYKEDEHVTERLLDIAADDVKEVLSKVIAEDNGIDSPADLSQSDLATLGNALLRQFPDSVLKK